MIVVGIDYVRSISFHLEMANASSLKDKDIIDHITREYGSELDEILLIDDYVEEIKSLPKRKSFIYNVKMLWRQLKNIFDK